MTRVTCTNPAHGVTYHIAGTASARACAAQGSVATGAARFGAPVAATRNVAITPEALRAGDWGTHDAEHRTHIIPVEDLGINRVVLSDERAERINDYLDDAFRTVGDDGLPAEGSPVRVIEVPLSEIAGVRQESVAAEPLAWYVERGHDDNYDQEGWYDIDAPTGYVTREGDIVVADGTHRYVSRVVRGDATMRLLVVDEPAALTPDESAGVEADVEAMLADPGLAEALNRFRAIPRPEGAVFRTPWLTAWHRVLDERKRVLAPVTRRTHLRSERERETERRILRATEGEDK